MQVNSLVILFFFVLLLLAKSSSSLRRASISDKKCSDSEEELEAFWKQQNQDVEYRYHLTIKENLFQQWRQFYWPRKNNLWGINVSHKCTLLQTYCYKVYMQSPEHYIHELLAAELASVNGVKPITEFAILVDVGSCQQPVGWFDQLDPQWNITQCGLARVCNLNKAHSMK